MLLAGPATAGSFSGIASLRAPLPLPADAPARERGRVRRQPAGVAPFRFTIPYRVRDLTPGRPSPPLTLQLVPVASASLGRLPASWRGEIPGADGPVRWQLEPNHPRLVLRGGREAPLFFQPLAGGAALRTLDPEGRPFPSSHPNQLLRLATPQPIEPRLHLLGMMRYQADAATIRLCATGQRLPIAMEADYRRLERAYLQARSGASAGSPLLVERFVGVHPGKGCPSHQGPSAADHQSPRIGSGRRAGMAADSSMPTPRLATGLPDGHSVSTLMISGPLNFLDWPLAHFSVSVDLLPT